ncbi:MAG: DUF4143 domain-containing protein [Actinomycetota bacterium]|nr:DUF4143 domain-containing protein [Actinomycetota bacterium]
MVEASFTGAYVRRVVDDELDELFGQLSAILLDGPKGVGKTATAGQRCRTTRRLDVDADRAVIEADPALVGLGEPPVLIDEWQRVPAVWDAVRRLVDDDPAGGHFLLTGSPPTGGTHSGAGRITSLRMRPLSLFERRIGDATVSLRELLAGSRPPVTGRSPFGLADYVDEIIAGGFPGMRHLTGRARDRQLDGYLERIVDRDMPEAGFTVRRPATVRAWLRAYAAATATTASWETIRNAATSGMANKPAKTTSTAYTELLIALRILDPIDAWLPTNNHFARLTAWPKHHLVDPALAARLLGRSRGHLLAGEEGPVSIPRDGTLLGGLFESLVALSIRTFAQAVDANVYHLRTQSGRHEIDFVVEHGGRVLALEAKLAAAVDDRDVRHLRWLRDELGDDVVDTAVITTGPEAYRRPDGVAVVPLALLGP